MARKKIPGTHDSGKAPYFGMGAFTNILKNRPGSVNVPESFFKNDAFEKYCELRPVSFDMLYPAPKEGEKTSAFQRLLREKWNNASPAEKAAVNKVLFETFKESKATSALRELNPGSYKDIYNGKIKGKEENSLKALQALKLGEARQIDRQKQEDSEKLKTIFTNGPEKDALAFMDNDGSTFSTQFIDDLKKQFEKKQNEAVKAFNDESDRSFETLNKRIVSEWERLGKIDASLRKGSRLTAMQKEVLALARRNLTVAQSQYATENPEDHLSLHDVELNMLQNFRTTNNKAITMEPVNGKPCLTYNVFQYVFNDMFTTNIEENINELIQLKKHLNMREGNDEMELNINCADPDRANKAARLAYQKCIDANYPRDKIKINVNGVLVSPVFENKDGKVSLKEHGELYKNMAIPVELPKEKPVLPNVTKKYKVEVNTERDKFIQRELDKRAQQQNAGNAQDPAPVVGGVPVPPGGGNNPNSGRHEGQDLLQEEAQTYQNAHNLIPGGGSG